MKKTTKILVGLAILTLVATLGLGWAKVNYAIFKLTVQELLVRSQAINTTRFRIASDGTPEMFNASSVKVWGIDATGNVETNATTPVNYITNIALGVWKSGTTASDNGNTTTPVGWYFLHNANLGNDSGATRYDLVDVTTAGSDAVEIRPGFTHSMLIEGHGVSGSTDWLLYPDSGISTAQTWYQKFAGTQCQFGAWVYTTPGTTSVTDFIRPLISTSSLGTSGITTASAYGDYADGGWDFISATTTIPNGATALEFGFEIFQKSTSSGNAPSGYIVGPVFVSGVTVNRGILKPNEIVWLDQQLEPWSGGSSFEVRTGYAAHPVDLSADVGWNGLIPDDAEALYVTVAVQAAWPNALHFYGDNALGGTSVYGSGGSGSTIYNEALWVPVSSTGILNIGNIVAFSGTSFFVHAIEMR